METEKKLAVLSRLARALNGRQAVWAVGASLLLYLKGKAPSFHDIDLMVAEADVGKAKEALLSLGTLQAPNPNAQYKTKHFLEFTIDGVEVDVMAGFCIVKDGAAHYFPLKKEDIQDAVYVNGELVPLQSLAAWRTYYQLMGRVDKVGMIGQ